MGIKKYVFGQSSMFKHNTFIGGVSNTINTVNLLAERLGISSSKIQNFSIDGDNIACHIISTYEIRSGAFARDLNLTYYIDKNGLVTSLAESCFLGADNVSNFKFDGITNLIHSYLFRSGTINAKKQTIELNNLVSCIHHTFYDEDIVPKIIKIPKCKNLGNPAELYYTFYGQKAGSTIYINRFLETANNGSPDADLQFAASRGVNIIYVDN